MFDMFGLTGREDGEGKIVSTVLGMYVSGCCDKGRKVAVGVERVIGESW